jgi:hypothetical protein
MMSNTSPAQRSFDIKLEHFNPSILSIVFNFLPLDSFRCLALSCNQFCRVVRHQARSLTFHGGRYPQLTSPYLLVERFPNCKHITCAVSSTDDVSANVPAVLDAARHYNRPITSLTIRVVSNRLNISLSRLTQLAPQLLPSLTTLQLHQCELNPLTCKGLYALLGLSRLELSECHEYLKLEKGARDLGGLSSLQNLRHLSCTSHNDERLKLTECTFLSALTQLTSLAMYVKGSLDPISYCTSLASLTVLTPGKALDEGAKERKDFLAASPGFSYSFLSSLNKLTSLKLTVEVDLTPFGSCSSMLRSLSLSGTLTASATAALAQLTALTSFSTSYVRRHHGLDSILVPALKHLGQLQQLKLPNIYYDHLEALAIARCTSLSSLESCWTPSDKENQDPAVLYPPSATRLQPLPHIIAYTGMAWFQCPAHTTHVLPFQLLPSLESFDAAYTTTTDAVLFSLAKHCPQLTEMKLAEVCDFVGLRSAAGLCELTALPALRTLDVVADEPPQVQMLSRLTQLTSLTVFIAQDEAGWPIVDADLMPLLQLKMLEELVVLRAPALSTAAAFSFVFGWQRMKRLEFDWLLDEGEQEEEAEEEKVAREDAIEHLRDAVSTYNAGFAEEIAELDEVCVGSCITINFPRRAV